MNDETKQKLKSVAESVTNAIEANEVKMRSRYYFMARTGLWVFGSLLMIGLSLYLVSFIAFVFRGNGLHLLPQLGPKGWVLFVTSLPWLLILSVLIVFGLLHVLSTKFSFVYKRPLVHSILLGIILLVALGALIGQSTLHDRMYERNKKERLPFAGGLYQGAIGDRPGTTVGKISEYSETSFILIARDGTPYAVSITNETRTPRKELTDGMTVIVIGEYEDETIEAHGVRPFDSTRAIPNPPYTGVKRNGPPPLRP